MSTTEPPPLDAAQSRAIDLVRGSQRFLLCGHQRPDGDCIGSQAALARVLELLGKDVWIVNPDAPEGRYEYLSREVHYRVFNGGDLPVHDVAVMLDFCELSRTGAMTEPLRSARSKKLVVDHHVHQGDAWWDECFVDVKAAATGLLVRRIARALGVALDPVAALGVFTSIVTDTGWFKYSNTDAETLTAAGELVAAGVVPSELFNAIYQRRSHQHPPFVAQLLSRLEYHAAGRLAVIDQTLAETLPGDLVDSDEVLDILRSVNSVEVVLYLRELEKGFVKLSARSKSDYDVNALAREFGGGGHKKASGATIQGSLADTRLKVLAKAIERFPAGAKSGRT